MTEPDQSNEAHPTAYLDLTADLVSAYVANNNVPVAELPALFESIHAALVGLSREAATEPRVDKPTPTQIRKSITHDALISFEDGKPYKTLKRHLSGTGLTPEAYRAKWGLPVDYPMTALGYSETRSKLAIGLGLGRKRPAENPPEPDPTAVEAFPSPKKRGRKSTK